MPVQIEADEFAGVLVNDYPAAVVLDRDSVPGADHTERSAASVQAYFQAVAVDGEYVVDGRVDLLQLRLRLLVELVAGELREVVGIILAPICRGAVAQDKVAAYSYVGALVQGCAARRGPGQIEYGLEILVGYAVGEFREFLWNVDTALCQGYRRREGFAVLVVSEGDNACGSQCGDRRH